MKIALLLNPSIGAINKKGFAGTEVMFFKDTTILNKQYKTTSYARFSFKDPYVRRIYYPVILIKIAQKLNFTGKLYPMIDAFLRLTADIVYILQFILLERHSDIIIGYSFPSVALIRYVSNKNIYILIQSYETLVNYSFFSGVYKQTQFIFCSNYIKTYYLQKYQGLSCINKPIILHNSVDSSSFYQIKKHDHRKIILLYASAWEKEKGLDILLESFTKLRPHELSKITLTIASNKNLWHKETYQQNDDYLCKIDVLLKKLSNITQLGGVQHKDMNKIYNSHDVLIFPSVWGEPCSVTLIESLFCKLPIIAFNVGGNSEILLNTNSIIPNTSSSDALARTLRKLIQIGVNEMFNNKSLKGHTIELTDDYRTKILYQLVNQSEHSGFSI